MATIVQPTSLIPVAKASGRCPPSLIRDEQIIEGGVFEMAMLKALGNQEGKILFFVELLETCGWLRMMDWIN